MPRAKKEVIKKNEPVKTLKGKQILLREDPILTIPVYSLTGEKSGQIKLNNDVFGKKVNKNLLSQALRVYLNNQKTHFAHTKTRGEVKGSTAKIYKQKGTGRARHGGKRAPIFVGGGIALGPKYRKVILSLPQKMKKSALKSALLSKLLDQEVIAIKDLEKVSGKTKEIAKLLGKLQIKSALLITDKKNDLLKRSVKNLPKIDYSLLDNINVLEVLKHKNLIFNEAAIKSFKGEKTSL